MTARLAEIWRHPVKSHGRERLAEVMLEAGEALPGDRRFALALEGHEVAPGAWAGCRNFARTSINPALAPFAATLEADGQIALSHPDLGALRIDPADEAARAALVDWVQPLVPEGHPAPVRLMELEGRGYTDSDFPSVTLCNFASHRAVEAALGQEISHLRWRGNLWVEGLEPWAEWDLVGKEFKLGDALLLGVERTTRCAATMANPETGTRDVPTLKALSEGWGHRDFSIRCKVIGGGRVFEGCEVSLP